MTWLHGDPTVAIDLVHLVENRRNVVDQVPARVVLREPPVVTMGAEGTVRSA